MTPEYGAASQLEKIDMLDFADFVAINKFDRRGAEDALRDVSKQYQRNRKAFSATPDQMPVFGTMAARFNDDGVTALYQAVVALLKDKGLHMEPGRLSPVSVRASSRVSSIVSTARARYLAEIAETLRSYKQHALEQSRIARERQQLSEAKRMLQEASGTRPLPLQGGGQSDPLPLQGGGWEGDGSARHPPRPIPTLPLPLKGRERRSPRASTRSSPSAMRRSIRRPRSCSTCGRTCRRPIPAPSTW